MQGRILIVEDDLITRALLTEFLKGQGRDVHAVEDGQGALAHCRANRIDIVLLDILLPDRDGLSLIQLLREINPKIGIIVVSSKRDPTERVVGLEMGADDYLPKPFELAELAARIKALERRDHAIRSEKGGWRWFGPFRLDFDSHIVLRRDGSVVPMTNGEFRILSELVRAAGQVVTRRRLLDVLRGDGEPAASRTLDVVVSRLRGKLEGAEVPRLIATVYGTGYRLEVSRGGEALPGGVNPAGMPVAAP